MADGLACAQNISLRETENKYRSRPTDCAPGTREARAARCTRGRLRKRADAERMAEFCIATVQGAMLMGKLERSSDTVAATAREALEHLKGYLKGSAPE